MEGKSKKILHEIQHSSLDIELKRKMLYKMQDFPVFMLLLLGNCCISYNKPYEIPNIYESKL